MRAFYLAKTTCRQMLDHVSSGVWMPIGEITPGGSIDVYHTVLKDKFRVVVTDYIHIPERSKS